MHRTIHILMSAMAIVVFISASCKSPAKPFWQPDLKPGPYAVGFRILYQRDSSRSWSNRHGNDDEGRPIRVSIWYPADSTESSHRMSYGDYLEHHGPDNFKRFDQAMDKMDADSWLSDLRELSPPGQPMFDRLKSLPVAAYRDAPAARGPFSLLLYSGGKGSRADSNLELGEYLASHGYIVATVPQLGPSQEQLELGSSAQEISLHTDDFDTALSILRKVPEIASTNLAAAGHSAGGETAVELALRHPEIKAVVGLDASYGMGGGARIFKELPEYAPGRPVGASLLDLRRAPGSQGVTLDLTAVDALRWADLYRVSFAKAYHGDFTEWGMVALKLGIPMPPNPDSHTRQVGYDVNRTTCRVVLDFLDAKLRGRVDAFNNLKVAMRHQPGITFQQLHGTY